MQTCPQCKGIGKINTMQEDIKTGAAMRKLREQRGISLRAVARFLDKTPSYISMLEMGKQRWNPSLEKKYKAAIEVE